MTCFYPLTAWKSRDVDDINPQTGKLKMVFREDQGYPNTKTELPCGQCHGCRLDRARSWAIRCLHEASLYDSNCFLTLTYDERHLPKDGGLQKTDVVKFMKKLRHHCDPVKIRFFQCGEYGELLKRPHHHMIIFNYDFPDKEPAAKFGENIVYNSLSLSKLWDKGHHSIGDVTHDSACYVARYILKKINGDEKEEHYGELQPEYCTMSRNPGIGKDWYEQFKNDLYNHDKCVIDSRFIARPPSYYDRLYESHHPKHFAELKRKRRLTAIANPENTIERREIKSRLSLINLKRLERSYEQAQLNRTSEPPASSCPYPDKG